MLEYLETLEDSSQRVEGCIMKILSFLDLKSQEHAKASGPSLLASSSRSSRAGEGARSLEVLIEDIIATTRAQEKQRRAVEGRPHPDIEIILEIGKSFALRRRLSDRNSYLLLSTSVVEKP